MARPCSIADALVLVGEKWSLLAVRELLYGSHRFGQIAAATGAPRDVLTARLRRLEDVGVLERRPYSERPPRFEYHLTESGRGLAPVLLQLAAWGDRWAGEGHPPASFGHRQHVLLPVLACATCGKPVRPGEVSVQSDDPADPASSSTCRIG